MKFDFQPILPVDAARFPKSWVEALCRPKNTTPSEWLSQAAAGGSDQIVPLELNWLTSAIAQAPKDRRISFNVSTRTLNSERFRSKFFTALRDAGIAGSNVCLEVTEYTPDFPNARALNAMGMIQSQNGLVAIDDLGKTPESTEWLSLGVFDVAKIDPIVYRWQAKQQHQLFSQLSNKTLRVFEAIETDREYQWALCQGATHIQSWYADQLIEEQPCIAS